WRSTSTLCPWLARIWVPVSSKAKRCLSLWVTTCSSSSRLIGKRLRAQASRKSSTDTQPPAPSVKPRRSGSCRRCLLRYLLTLTLRFLSMRFALSYGDRVKNHRLGLARHAKHQAALRTIHVYDAAGLPVSVPVQNRFQRLHHRHGVAVGRQVV